MLGVERVLKNHLIQPYCLAFQEIEILSFLAEGKVNPSSPTSVSQFSPAQMEVLKVLGTAPAMLPPTTNRGC